MLRSLFNSCSIINDPSKDEMNEVEQAVTSAEQSLTLAIDLRSNRERIADKMHTVFTSGKLLTKIYTCENYLKEVTNDELLVAVKFFETYGRLNERQGKYNDARAYYDKAIDIDQQLDRNKASRPERYILSYIGISRLNVSIAKMLRNRNPRFNGLMLELITDKLKNSIEFQDVAKKLCIELENSNDNRHKLIIGQCYHSISVNLIEIYKMLKPFKAEQSIIDLSTDLKCSLYKCDIAYIASEAETLLKEVYGDLYEKSYENVIGREDFTSVYSARKTMVNDLCLIRMSTPLLKRNPTKSYRQLAKGTGITNELNKFNFSNYLNSQLENGESELSNSSPTTRPQINVSNDEIEIF
jgi:hypothetical protein